ncbi:MAG TPA: MFS transporter [Alphaproteobacteria bacterium]|nr:MFS transporter [Alphaproteobacteria bacterium]
MERLLAQRDRRLWAVVILGFTALAIAFSARAALSLVLPVWERDIGWSRSFVSGTGAAALIVMAGVAPFAGSLVDRRGPRTVLVLGLGMIAAGCALVAAAEARWWFVLAYAGVSAIGFGMVATHVVATCIARLTVEARGLATGVATAGATAGQFAVVPALAALLETMSWRWSFAALGLAAAALVPLVLLSLKSAVLDGQERPGDRAGTGGAGKDIRYLLGQPVFHLLFWSFLLCGYTTTGVIETHLMPYAAFCGFPPVPGATAYGILSAANLGGMVLAGWLTDRVNRPVLLATIYVVRGLAFLLLMSVESDYERLVLFAVIFGVVDYATVPVTASLAASHLGTRVMGLAMGLISAGHAVGGAAGAFAGGYVFELSGAYDALWWSSLAAAIAAGLCALLIRSVPPGGGAAKLRDAAFTR